MTQRITIDKNVTDIMKLPCVCFCRKDEDELCYVISTKDGNYTEAREGDVLIQEGDIWKVESR